MVEAKPQGPGQDCCLEGRQRLTQLMMLNGGAVQRKTFKWLVYIPMVFSPVTALRFYGSKHTLFKRWLHCHCYCFNEQSRHERKNVTVWVKQNIWPYTVGQGWWQYAVNKKRERDRERVLSQPFIFSDCTATEWPWNKDRDCSLFNTQFCLQFLLRFRQSINVISSLLISWEPVR